MKYVDLTSDNIHEQKCFVTFVSKDSELTTLRINMGDKTEHVVLMSWDETRQLLVQLQNIVGKKASF